ncbi:MAG: hypothetical protein NVS4B12_26890 [Ktedonobacteraceae bacterium]
MFTVSNIKNILTLYGVLTIALLLFTLIVAHTKVYRTQRRFWSIVAVSWSIAYLLGSVLFLLFRMDVIFTIMAASLVGYLIMGDLPFRKKGTDEDFEEIKHTRDKETAN